MAVSAARGVALTAATAIVLVLLLPSARAHDDRPEPLQAGADWPMYGRSAAHIFSTGATPPAELGLVWSFAANDSLSTPVLSGDHVYVADLNNSEQSTRPHLVVHRLHEANGSNRPIPGVNGWGRRVSIPGTAAIAPPRSLAVDASRVYALWTVNHVGTTNYSDVLAALDVGTGQAVWTFMSSSWTSAVGNATRSAPVLANDRVIFGSQDGNVTAVNATTGALVWWFPGNGPLTTVPAFVDPGSPSDPIVYVTSGSDLIYLDAPGKADGDQGIADGGAWTGDELRRVTVNATIDSSPVIAGSLAYVDAGGTLSAFDFSQGGAPIWSRTTEQESEGTPAVLADTIFARRSGGRVYAYDRISGELGWARPGLDSIPGAEDIAAADGRVFLSANRGGSRDLVTLDAANGDILDANTGWTTLGAPIAAADKVFVSEGARLLAFRGKPDLAVEFADIVPHLSTAQGGVATGYLTVRIQNDGTEPATNVRVQVYDGAYDPPNPVTNRIGIFVVGNATAPVTAGGGTEGNDTDVRTWSVGTHTVRVVIEPAATETNVANNQVAVLIAVQAGPSPPPGVVGAGPYWAALLLGFVAGVAILYVPLRRLRDLRRKKPEEKRT